MVMKRARKKEKKKSTPNDFSLRSKSDLGSESSVEDSGYSIGKWKGLPHFQCNKCPFSTLDEKLMQAHAEDHKKKGKRIKK